MTETKAAVAAHTDPVHDCPVVEGTLAADYEATRRSALRLATRMGRWLEDRTTEEKVAWLRTGVGQSRALFQPWSMEILYTTAILGTTRFNELQKLLGVSSRTLSDKLKALQDEGLMDRLVHDTRPVRIEYELTPHGIETMALAAPLYTHLNLHALEQAGRL